MLVVEQSDTDRDDIDTEDASGPVDELSIIRSIMRQLDKLDTPGQCRSLAYLCSRYDWIRQA